MLSNLGSLFVKYFLRILTRIQNWEFWYIPFMFFSGICPYIQSYSALLRNNHVYWDIIKAYSDLNIFSTLCSLCSLTIFWGLGYLEPEAYLKPCETLTRHTQNLVQCLHMQKPGILAALKYSEPFHNCIPKYIQNLVTKWKFTNIENSNIFNKGKNKTVDVYLLSKSFLDVLHRQCY